MALPITPFDTAAVRRQLALGEALDQEADGALHARAELAEIAFQCHELEPMLVSYWAYRLRIDY